MSYIKGWNYALDKAITIISEELGINNLAKEIIQKLKEQKVYEN